MALELDIVLPFVGHPLWSDFFYGLISISGNAWLSIQSFLNVEKGGWACYLGELMTFDMAQIDILIVI